MNKKSLDVLIELQLKFGEKHVTPLVLDYIKYQSELQSLPNVSYNQSVAGAIYKVRCDLMGKYNLRN